VTTDDVPPRPLPGGIGYVFMQLADDLEARITAGEFPPGSRLRGRALLAAQYGVAEMTVRRALIELEARGLVRRDAARGALVILHGRST
jgi:DNA-binding GntR family transcriptional regulator